MKKLASAFAVILMLALMTGTCFASPSNFIGGGIALKPMDGNANSKSFIGAISGQYGLLNDKLELGGRLFVSYLKDEGGKYDDWGVNVDIFAQYIAYTWEAIGLSFGPRIDLVYTTGFFNLADKPNESYNAFALRAGLYLAAPLGDVGKIYGTVGTTLVDSYNPKEAWKKYDILGGLQFDVTEHVAIKAEIEYTQKQTVFTTQIGYSF